MGTTAPLPFPACTWLAWWRTMELVPSNNTQVCPRGRVPGRQPRLYCRKPGQLGELFQRQGFSSARYTSMNHRNDYRCEVGKLHSVALKEKIQKYIWSHHSYPCLTAYRLHTNAENTTISPVCSMDYTDFSCQTHKNLECRAQIDRICQSTLARCTVLFFHSGCGSADRKQSPLLLAGALHRQVCVCVWESERECVWGCGVPTQ